MMIAAVTVAIAVTVADDGCCYYIGSCGVALARSNCHDDDGCCGVSVAAAMMGALALTAAAR